MTAGDRHAFLRFLLSGGVAAGVNLLARIGLSEVMSFEAAVAVAYLIGMTVAYLLARIFVFAPSGKSIRHEYARFALVNVVALIQVWVVSVAMARWVFPSIGFTFHADLIAHGIGVLSPVFTSYYGHKLFTFGKTK